MNEPLTTDERLTALAPREVFVLCAWYSDKSSFKLLGVYELQRAADDRKKILDAGGSVYQTRVIKMKVNVADPAEVTS